MVLRNRGYLEIIGDILEICLPYSDGANVTKLLFGANLTHEQVTHYITVMIKAGLVEKIPAEPSGTRARFTYRITSKGSDYVACRRALSAMIADVLPPPKINRMREATFSVD